MNIVIYAATILTLPCHSGISYADTALSAQELIAIALKENLDLKAAQFIVEEAKGKLLQTGRLTNPELEVSHASDRAFHNEGEFAVTTTLRQKFPISSRLKDAKEVGYVDLAIAEAEIKNLKRLIIAEVLKLYHEILLVEERARLLKELRNNLAELVKVSERRLNLAEIAHTDVNLAKLELEKLSIIDIDLQIEKKTKSIELHQLLGRSPDFQLLLKGTCRLSVSPSTIANALTNFLERRPDRILATLQANRAYYETKLARAESWEDWTLGVGHNYERNLFPSPLEDQNDSFLGVALTIPLPIWNRNEGKLVELKAQESRRQADLTATEMRIQAEVEASRSKLLMLLPLIQRFEHTSLKLAQDNVRILQKSYSQGLIGTASVLQGQHQLTELQQEYSKLLHEFALEYTHFQSATVSFEVPL